MLRRFANTGKGLLTAAERVDVHIGELDPFVECWRCAEAERRILLILDCLRLRQDYFAHVMLCCDVVVIDNGVYTVTK